MSKIVIPTVYFNLAHICKILMYSNTLTHLHTQILMLDVTLSKWIMKTIEKNSCAIFDKIWNTHISCEH